MALLKQQPPNPKPRRLQLGPCHRHPDSPVTTGLCPSCLRERLSLLNPTTSVDGASTSASTSAGAPPELRRCKTFSAKNGESVLGLEPRRRSCDVRGRSSLSNLFDLDDDDDGNGGLSDVVRVESKNLGFLGKGTCPVPEVVEEEVESNCDDFEISRVSDFRNVVEDEDEFEDSKTTMKEFIDLEFQAKNTKPSNNNRRDFKEIAGSFWVAASVFSKKLRKWKKKQRNRDHNDDEEHIDVGVGLGEMQLERLRGRRLTMMKSRDTQSEIGFGRRSCDSDPRGSMDFGRASIDGFGAFGRISCDTDPRFSVDLGRASVDCGAISGEDPRRSFDAPRASWDGYLTSGAGGRPLPPPRPVVSVIENAMATVYGFDHHRMLAGVKTTRVETARDPQMTRFEAFDRSGSGSHHRRRESQTLEKPLPDARVSPASAIKLLITEKELNEWRLNSMKDDNSSESFSTASKDMTSVSSSSNSSAAKELKKCRHWSKLWSFWGLLNPRKVDKYSSPNAKEMIPQECPRASSAENYIRNGSESGFDPDWKLPRSHSSTASSRKAESNSKALVLDRNRSARYSPNRHLDNGLLRFYLTPLRSRSRRRTKLPNKGVGRLKNSRSIARSVLRL